MRSNAKIPTKIEAMYIQKGVINSRTFVTIVNGCFSTMFKS